MYIISLYSQLKWNYVSVVYSNSVYGIDAYRSFVRAKANHMNICIHRAHMITVTLQSEDYMDLVDQLYTDDHLRGKNWFINVVCNP